MVEKYVNRTANSDQDTSKDVADKPAGFVENAKKDSLTWAGRSFMVADVALMASGLLSGRYREAAGGLLWLAGGGVLARYGSESQERALENLSRNLSEYLKKEGIDIPEHGQISRETIAKNGGLLHKIEDFIYKHPSQVANAIYVYGGSQLFRSGMTHNKIGDTISGAAVTAGALAGLLIPQSKEPIPRTGDPIKDSWSAIREKPLRVTGSLYMISPFALSYAGYKEFRTNPADKSYVFKLIAATGNLIANSLITLSSKEHGATANNKDVKDIYEGAASIIAAQPKEIRDETLRHIATFIGAQPETDITTKQAEAMLNKTVDTILHKQCLDEKYADSSWKERINQCQEAPPSLQV